MALSPLRSVVFRKTFEVNLPVTNNRFKLSSESKTVESPTDLSSFEEVILIYNNG